MLVLLVLTPLGATINGAHSWIVIGGGFSLQPSEFVKITIILGMAMLLAARVDAGDRPHPDHRTVVQALGLAAVPIADRHADARPRLGHGAWPSSCSACCSPPAPPTAGSSACSAPASSARVAVWQLGMLDEYQIDRFAAFANPEPRPGGRRLQHQPGADRDRLAAG